MKKLILPMLCLLLIIVLSSFAMAETTFKAGIVIPLMIVAVVGLAIWVYYMLYKAIAEFFPIAGAMDVFWDESAG